jgi:cytosine deaminase
MADFITIPQTLARFRLANTRVPTCLLADAARLEPGADGLAPCDIVIERDRIASIDPVAVVPDGLPHFDLDRGIVLPRLVDVHTHIDKGHIWHRAPNPDGSFMGARTTVMADREANWTEKDVRKRMDFALRCAFAHGTGALRTHIDSYPKQIPISWPLFAEMRAEWKGRIALQAVALYPIDLAINDDAQFRDLVEMVAKHDGVLGGLTFLGTAPDEKTDAALDAVFAAANANGLDLDFHVDESDSADARTLERIADAALRHKFKGQIVAGHCCSLALADDAERAATIAKVAQARIAVVSLPMCNMYLQDRKAGRTPRWRGVAPLHELANAGVTVMAASDNTRDPFHAYGDLDLIEVYREATRILHFDHAPHPWLKTVAATAGEVMRLPNGRMAVEAPAGMILTRARTMNELLSRPQTDRVVLCAGKQVDRTLPDYRELDEASS